MVADITPGVRTRSRILSLEEANRMLPLLDKIVTDIMTTWQLIIQRRSDLEAVEKAPESTVQGSRDDEVDGLKSDLNNLIDRINSFIREVEELGCFVEEFKRGVVNFPSLYIGRKVFLCWKPGDPHVMYWHELDESYNERSPIRDPRDFLLTKPNLLGPGSA